MNSPMSEETPFGSYFGADLTDIECQAIGLQCIPDIKRWKGEARLYRTKWFDYRQLSEIKATYLFAEYYRRAYRRLMCRKIGIERGQYSKGFRGDDIFKLKKVEYTGFWKARRMADSLGIPYDFYCNAAMTWSLESLWVRPPRPTQLYSEKILTHITEKWDSEVSAAIWQPLSDFYQLDNYVKHPDQDAFQNWLCDRIETKPNKDMALANYIEFNPLLTKEIAIDRFGEELVNKASRLF